MLHPVRLKKQEPGQMHTSKQLCRAPTAPGSHLLVEDRALKEKPSQPIWARQAAAHSRSALPLRQVRVVPGVLGTSAGPREPKTTDVCSTGQRGQGQSMISA